MIRALVGAVIAVGALAACGSSNDDESPATVGNGVDDVKAACDLRAAWTRRDGDACKGCLYTVRSAPCACDERAGMCNAQSQKRIVEPDCSSTIDGCVTACGVDCACVDACYASAAQCRKVASALDGCMAAACEADCR